MKLVVLFLFIRIITCFLNGPLVVIWMWSLGLSLLLTMFCIWSVFFTLKVENMFFILMTFSIWEVESVYTI